jgi:hypothetical protein
MGKITFRRATITLVRSKINALLPVAGSLLFLVGSLYFWPTAPFGGTHDSSVDTGATLFVAGSALYTIAPLLDFADMSLALRDDLSRKPPHETSIGTYERLYKAQIVRSQRANALLYACGGACFFAGSFLFFSEERLATTHGAWLYVVGSVLSFLAAYLAASTALELKNVAEEQAEQAEQAEQEQPAGPHGPRPRASASSVEEEAAEAPPRSAAAQRNWRRWLKRWSDADAQILSCSLYLVGDVVYALGSVFYFPTMAVSTQKHLIVRRALPPARTALARGSLPDRSRVAPGSLPDRPCGWAMAPERRSPPAPRELLFVASLLRELTSRLPQILVLVLSRRAGGGAAHFREVRRDSLHHRLGSLQHWLLH